MRATYLRAVPAPAILAIVLTAVAQLEIWLLWMPDPDEAIGLVPVAVRAVAALGSAPLTLSLGLGRRLPLLSLLLAIPAVALLPAGPLETSIAVAIAIGFAAFRGGLGASGPLAVALGALAMVGVVVATSLVHAGTVDEVGDLALLVLLLIGPWLAGLAIRLRHERVTELESVAARSEAARHAAAAMAVADERARIARELHDVVAHAISVIVLQARGGRRAIIRDTAAATEALDVIESTATRALAEMRRLVVVLRPGVEAPGLEPPPGLDQLDALVSGVRGAGLDVDVRVEGEPVELAPGIDLAAYRLVQEALTNTLRHAQAAESVHVVVRYLPGAIEIEVLDVAGPAATRGSSSASPRSESGHGMIGMRERAELYGGSVEFGPQPGGGFRVLARLPVATDPR